MFADLEARLAEIPVKLRDLVRAVELVAAELERRVGVQLEDLAAAQAEVRAAQNALADAQATAQVTAPPTLPE